MAPEVSLEAAPGTPTESGAAAAAAVPATTSDDVRIAFGE
jgi:hypothetical protein